MKKIILASFSALLISVNCHAQHPDEGAIKQTILGFSKAGDTNDADQLATYLDDNYRVVMNRLFGSSEVSIISKNAYLEKIKKKEYGGDNRQVNIQSIMLNSTSASAKVSFIGTKMTFVSILTLLKNGNNQWKIVSDVPIVK